MMKITSTASLLALIMAAAPIAASAQSTSDEPPIIPLDQMVEPDAESPGMIQDFDGVSVIDPVPLEDGTLPIDHGPAEMSVTADEADETGIVTAVEPEIIILDIDETEPVEDAETDATEVEDTAPVQVEIVVPAPTEPLPTIAVTPGFTTEQLQSAMGEYIAELDRTAGVLDVTWLDMSMNGQLEALVVLDNCDDHGCEWQLIALKEDGIQSVGTSWAKTVEFMPTEGGGAVVWSDGVTWAYSGDWMYPYGNLLWEMTPGTGTEADLQIINEQTDFDIEGANNIEVYRMNLTPSSPGTETIYYVTGLVNSFGNSGYPYIVTDGEGIVLGSGLSLEPPMVFPNAETGGSFILLNTPLGYDMIDVE